ncbi:uncharacterized protein G2W53_033980 [Senna tora]|uniref:Transposase MuDR plant domain-containing protein n=1 Tax=Senna tora TaxID=362788 RepID=A0A834WDD6_9FABA|nr:uncharacterized protein G2W53_033980 [Senna tora]
MNPLRYGQFHVGEDSDFQFVIQRHLQICSEFGLMEFYVEISTHDINMDIENQLSFDYNTQTTPQTDQTLIASSSRLQIVGTCQPPIEDGKFSDEDEYEASVLIRMSHQDKEDDNVWEDVVEEELANFYSQVDVERARGFTGDFGPRSEDVRELYEGMKFPTKAALRRHVKLYHIKNNCTFVVAKSGSNFEDWRCPKFGKECAWILRATQKSFRSRLNNVYHSRMHFRSSKRSEYDAITIASLYIVIPTPQHNPTVLGSRTYIRNDLFVQHVDRDITTRRRRFDGGRESQIHLGDIKRRRPVVPGGEKIGGVGTGRVHALKVVVELDEEVVEVAVVKPLREDVPVEVPAGFDVEVDAVEDHVTELTDAAAAEVAGPEVVGDLFGVVG